MIVSTCFSSLYLTSVSAPALLTAGNTYRVDPCFASWVGDFQSAPALLRDWGGVPSVSPLAGVHPLIPVDLSQSLIDRRSPFPRRLYPWSQRHLDLAPRVVPQHSVCVCGRRGVCVCVGACSCRGCSCDRLRIPLHLRRYAHLIRPDPAWPGHFISARCPCGRRGACLCQGI